MDNKRYIYRCVICGRVDALRYPLRDARLVGRYVCMDCLDKLDLLEPGRRILDRDADLYQAFLSPHGE